MKNLVFNKRWLVFAFAFVTLIALGIWTLDEESGTSISAIVIGTVLLLGYVFVFPICCVINSQGITVYYAFGIIKKKAAWNELKYIEDHHSTNRAFPWWREYQIAYFKTKFPLWEIAYIPQNKKTIHLIEKYYGKSIKKYG